MNKCDIEAAVKKVLENNGVQAIAEKTLPISIHCKNSNIDKGRKQRNSVSSEYFGTSR